jgi:hypothetical protein
MTAWGQVEKEEIPLPEGVDGGSITDGTNQWDINASSATDGTLNDYEAPITSDHQFSSWWWYRVAGDTAETIMPAPDSETYIGDTATLTWDDVDGRGLFSAVVTAMIADGAPGAILGQELEVTNLSGGDLDLQVFAYTDMDMDGSSGTDSAIESTPTQIEIMDTSIALYHGINADAYRVDAFPIVRDALNDALVDDFANTGLPFAPGDYTGGFQWGAVVGAGASWSFMTGNCVNTGMAGCLDAAVFQDGFESGDTSAWSNTVP